MNLKQLEFSNQKKKKINYGLITLNRKINKLIIVS